MERHTCIVFVTSILMFIKDMRNKLSLCERLLCSVYLFLLYFFPEYCRNTEFESSEEDDLMEVNSEIFEEYELPSDDAKDEKEQFSDCDSTIDVSIDHQYWKCSSYPYVKA